MQLVGTAMGSYYRCRPILNAMCEAHWLGGVLHAGTARGIACSWSKLSTLETLQAAQQPLHSEGQLQAVSAVGRSASSVALKEGDTRVEVM